MLWIRLWGSAANAILTDTSGKILDAFYRRPRKNEVSGKIFAPAQAAGSTGGSPAARAAAKDYAVRELPGEGTFNQKIEKLFRENEGRGNTERLVAQADTELEVSENKLLANLEKLRARLGEYANLDRFRELGDLITSNLHAAAKGDPWLRVEDFFHDDAPVEIELAPGADPRAERGEVLRSSPQGAAREIQGRRGDRAVGAHAWARAQAEGSPPDEHGCCLPRAGGA